MTIWSPNIGEAAGPRYVAIADALSRDVETGQLSPGARLPTHRDLATRLGVTVGTISRAYAEAERRGVIKGEVGRGTYVRQPAARPTDFSRLTFDPSVIDLSVNRPFDKILPDDMAKTLRTLGERADLGAFLNYQPNAGRSTHRAAGAAWLQQGGLPADPDQVVVTDGCQHALSVVINALLRPGDTLLCESLTYAGVKAVASQLQLRLVGLDMDGEGILPDAFGQACKSTGARALVCVPTLQNPTTGIMSEARRHAIAEIARAHDVVLIEDDIYGFLVKDRPPPLTTFAPELACYVTSISKCMVPALRVGYVYAPRKLTARLALGVRTSVWMASPLMAEMATMWINDGTGERLSDRQRSEAVARQLIASRILNQWRIDTHTASFHLWLHLPEPWRAEEFAAQARSRGVAVTPPDIFAVGRTAIPYAVRICLNAADSRESLERGLSILAEMLNSSPESSLTTI